VCLDRDDIEVVAVNDPFISAEYMVRTSMHGQCLYVGHFMDVVLQL
jgi:hypothetical protein